LLKQTEQGYLIVALKNDSVDYIDCAQRLAQSIRLWHSAVDICLLTDCGDYNDPVFDDIRIISRGNATNAWADDWQVFFQTPFTETIKLEADMLIVSEIDHWWDLFRHRDLVISTGCKNWRGQTSSARQYRQVFDVNGLPDVYNAVTYWRRSQTARDFFVQVRDIFDHWDLWRRTIKYAEAVPSTDLVYAMAAVLVGVEKTTMPFSSYPRIVHMKPHHAGTVTDNWSQELVWEYHQGHLRIQTQAQWGAFHYNIKGWQP
jgi:hypothetical protein